MVGDYIKIVVVGCDALPCLGRGETAELDVSPIAGGRARGHGRGGWFTRETHGR